MSDLFHKMKCSKVKFIAVVLIFSVVTGVHRLLSHSEGDDGTGSYLTRLFSSKWQSSKAKPQEETWISGKL